VERKAREFIRWADGKLRADDRGAAGATALPQIMGVILGNAPAFLKAISDADKETRDRITRELKGCRFRSREEIRPGSGELPGK
jgi:hypothetical protein